MILSHKHRYVFVELPRTGSTAIARELREHYDGTDVLRKHATYRDFLRQATPDERTYFAFSGIRQPLDVAVSRYTNLTLNAKGVFTDPTHLANRNALGNRYELGVFHWVQANKPDFEQFLRHVYRLPYDTWASLDHHRLGYVIRFESLTTDFAEVLRRIGLQPVRPLPPLNPTPGRNADWTGYYTPGAIRRAVWVFGPYMAEWDYAFPPHWGPISVPLWSRVLYRALRLVRGFYWRYLRFGNYVRRRPGGMKPVRPPADSTLDD